MEWADPPELPTLTLPESPQLPPRVLEVPRAEIPSYKPLVVPPSNLRPPPGVKGTDTEEEPPKKEKAKPVQTKTTTPSLPNEIQIVEIPFTDLEVPMPSTTIMTTAGTTAFISVAATLTTTSLFKYIVKILKPIYKQLWNKLTKKKELEVS